MDDRVYAAEHLRDYLVLTTDFGTGHHSSLAVAGYQTQMGTTGDGVVGQTTRLVAVGLGVTLPPEPPHPRVMTRLERDQEFGELRSTWMPQPGNPEHVKPGTGFSTLLRTVALQHPTLGEFHLTLNTAAAALVQALWADWAAAGVLQDVQSVQSYSARFKRTLGTEEERLQHCKEVAALPNAADYLSTHSWGAALDINPGKNPQGRPPLPIGHPGSILRLLPAAERHGFAWGGRFTTADPEHFEVGAP